MSYAPITQNGIAKSEPLDFPDRKPARQDLTITIRAVVDGFDTEVCYTGSIDQLLAVTKRLRALGAEPVSAKPATTPPASPQRTKSAKVTPAYNDAGEAMCPVHHRELQSGAFGLFCSAKAQPGDVQNGKGYCALRFSE